VYCHLSRLCTANHSRLQFRPCTATSSGCVLPRLCSSTSSGRVLPPIPAVYTPQPDPADSCTRPCSLLPPFPTAYFHQSRLCTTTSPGCVMPQVPTVYSDQSRLCTITNPAVYHDQFSCVLPPVPAVHCHQSRLCTASIHEGVQLCNCRQSRVSTANCPACVFSPVSDTVLWPIPVVHCQQSRLLHTAASPWPVVSSILSPKTLLSKHYISVQCLCCCHTMSIQVRQDQSRLCTVTNPAVYYDQSSCVLPPVPAVHRHQSRLCTEHCELFRLCSLNSIRYCTVENSSCALHRVQAVSCHQFWLCTATNSGYVQPPVLAVSRLFPAPVPFLCRH
jgi:hypothetical protein